MKKRKVVRICLLGILLIITSGIFYAFKIEPYRLQVNTFEIENETTTDKPITIVQFTDTHIKEDFTITDFKKVVEKINAQQPDVVVFTGDLYDNYARYNDDENMIQSLSAIQATTKIAIYGNRDHGGGANQHYASIMERSGFHLLTNETFIASFDNGKQISFTGLDDVMLGSLALPDNIPYTQFDYNILLTHQPDVVDIIDSSPFGLALSGHSHGGQINIPFIPSVNEVAVDTTNFASTYSKGMYQNKNGTKLYVSTGVGTTHISARFGVVPEIAVFKLYV